MKIQSQIILVFSILLISINFKAQSKINLTLKKELDARMFTDQALRRQYDENITEKERKEIADSLEIGFDYMKKNVLILMNRYDSINILKVDEIILKHGYPGKTLVGESTSKAAWLVIQHSDKIDKYLPAIKIAAEKGELKFYLYAMMLDRFLMDNKKEQIYGSQGYESNGNAVIWPIKNPDTVNELRKKAGFAKTIEDYARNLFGKEFIYKALTMKDIKRIYPEFND